MTENINISYSYQAEPQGQVDTELMAFCNCELINITSKATLLLDRDSDKQTIVAPEVATALTYCTTFKTLPEHARTITESIPQLHDQLADVTKVLHIMDEAGLMLRAQPLCDRLNQDSAPATALAPTRLCIITCDRPAAVERLLDSMLQHASLGGHDELMLVDDSRHPDNGRQNHALVQKFNLSSSKPMRYVGAAQQRELLQQLLIALPDHENAIRFLIDRERWANHKSYGLARTVCLLLSVNYRCIVLDDDVLCRTVKPPQAGDGLSLGGGDSRELACYSSEQELLHHARYMDFDPATGHASCLGNSLAQGIRQVHPGGVNPQDLRDGNARMISSLRADSPILLTQCGSWGDPGVPGCNWFYHLGPASVQRLLANPGGLPSAMENRHYWLGRNRPNIGKMAVMSQITGLDNTQILPPYFPVFRGEDYLFASMLMFLHPAAAVLDYPWAIPHLPLEARGAGSGAGAAQPGLDLCARYLADHADFEPGVSTRTRFLKLSTLLRELAEHTPHSLWYLVRSELARTRSQQLERMEEQLRLAPQDATEWRAFLQEGIQQVSTAQQVPPSVKELLEAPADTSDEALLANAGKTLSEFSQAIAAWPTIRETAGSITQKLLDAGELTA